MSGQLLGFIILIVGLTVWLGSAILMGRRRSAQRAAFLQFCEQRRYKLDEWNEEDDQGCTLSADGWTLTVRRTRPASGDWMSEAVFLYERTDEERLCFAMQYTAGNTAAEDLPEPVRTLALAALQSMLGERADDFESIRTAFFERGCACVVMEPAEGSAERVIERLRPELLAWRGKTPIYVESGTERVRLRFKDCCPKTPERIEAAIRIGLTAMNKQTL